MSSEVVISVSSVSGELGVWESETVGGLLDGEHMVH